MSVLFPAGCEQVPYLEDPNTGKAMFESAAICAYLEVGCLLVGCCLCADAFTFMLRKTAGIWAAGGRAVARCWGAVLASRLQRASFAPALQNLLAYVGRLPTVCWLLG